MLESALPVPVDVLHPLATLHWEECCAVPLSGSVYILTDLVQWNSKVYVGITQKTLKYQSMLFEFSSTSDFSSWNVITTPENVHRFALTTYRSKLVLVGGRGQRNLWASDDGMDWQQSLPPMQYRRICPAVLNTGDPEYLVVVGGGRCGYAEDRCCDDKVEVLIEEQWWTLQWPIYPFSVFFRHYRVSTYFGNVYFFDEDHPRAIYYCQLKSFVAAIQCVPSNDDPPVLCWTNIQGAQSRTLVSNGQRLIMTGNGQYSHSVPQHQIVNAYSPSLPGYVEVGEISLKLYYGACCVLPGGDLICVGIGGNLSEGQLLPMIKVSFKVSPYNPDGPLTMGALSRLEAAGISVVTSLGENLEHLGKACGVSLDKCSTKYGWHVRTKTKDVDVSGVIKEWQFRAKEQLDPITWRSLFRVLKELGLEELSQQIDEYLGGVRCLSELCTSVIMSALLQRKSWDPDQLHGRLPEYVPPSVKRSLIHNFKEYTMYGLNPSITLGRRKREEKQ